MHEGIWSLGVQDDPGKVQGMRQDKELGELVQVVNSDDLEVILGPRPFRSTELRNIDRFREGFQKGGEQSLEEGTGASQEEPTDEEPGGDGPLADDPALEQPQHVQGRIVAT